LMNDTDCRTEEKEISGKRVKIRLIEFNGKVVELVRFGDIADVKQGLATGDNKYYLYQNPEAEGTYKSIKEYKEFLLSEDDLGKIRNNEDIRLKVIENGIHKSRDEVNFDPDLWFGGKYIIPYDKGGESDTESGWLPNYYVPTNYFIDWSTEAVKRLKTLTLKERNRINGNYGGNNKLCSRFQNKEFYFKEGITFSITGNYAPTFRLNSIGTFDVKGSFIDPPFDTLYCLGVLSSKLIKMISKVFIYNCVDMQVDAIKEIPFTLDYNKQIIELADKIIGRQKEDLKYDYLINEQIEIDKIIYQAYGLNEIDIREVGTWHKRRYPKLNNSFGR